MHCNGKAPHAKQMLILGQNNNHKNMFDLFTHQVIYNFVHKYMHIKLLTLNFR